jgi:type IV secretory pathway TrbD component
METVQRPAGTLSQIGGWNVRVWHAKGIGTLLWFVSIAVVEKLRGRVF